MGSRQEEKQASFPISDAQVGKPTGEAQVEYVSLRELELTPSSNQPIFTSSPFSIPRFAPTVTNANSTGQAKQDEYLLTQDDLIPATNSSNRGRVTLGFLVLNEALDWETRRKMGVDRVQYITMEREVKEKWRKFYETGQSLLAAYSGSDIEELEDAIRIPSDLDCLEVKIFRTPDPDVEGGTLLLCLAAIGDPEGDTYIPAYGNRLTDTADALLPGIEALASTLPASPRVRSVMVLLEQDGDWKSLYWDGKRWINVVYLEWQTAESLGLPSHDEE
ncbi:hypothetical protein GQX73_g7343 [Xylaria multiplex]|uniref:Uncharacterized protein n=1 Tax=Xylaria multiplex TaxID=323545 RepID=A0A7C8IKY6_9PEZI|nr:hypothetical protein GQX73_g7343 [Xylaria multiplex]